MEEIWKNIKGYEGLYQVSNLGRVKSFNRGKERILKQIPNSTGYLSVALCKDKKVKQYLVHRLVAGMFISNPDNKPEVDHINTIITDNKVENLRWTTRKENGNNPLTIQHLSKALTEVNEKKKISIVQLNKDNSFVRYWDSASDVEKELGYANSHINVCCEGKRKNAYGYKWQYKDYYFMRERIRKGVA